MNTSSLECQNRDELVFGSNKHPPEYWSGLKIGLGEVVREVKSAPGPGTELTLERPKAEYSNVTNEILDRALNLGLPSIQLETECVAQMICKPKWGEEILRVQRDILERHHDDYGIQCALRVTIGDVRAAEDGLR